MRLTALLALCLLGIELRAAVFRAGFAQTDITPPVGYRMYGSLYETYAQGTHDPLFAKAVVFEQGDEKAALVVCDLCFVSRNLSVPARERAAQLTGIPAGNIVITATHTHGGPEYDGVQRDLRHARELREKGRDEHEPFDYLAQLSERIATAVSTAQKTARPAKLETLNMRQPGIAFNRRYHMKDGSVRFNPGKRNPDIVSPAGPTDTELPFVLFREAQSDAPFGSLTVFAMHVATFSKDRTWGADYPGVLAARLEKHFGAPNSGSARTDSTSFISIFGQGTAGDINHIDVTSDRPQPGDTEPIRIGNTLAETLIAVQRDLRPISEPRFAVRSRTVHAPLVEVTEEQVLRARDILERTDRPGGIAFLVTVEAWKILNTDMFRKRHGDKLPLEVNAFRFGPDTALVTLPHEVFVELGLAIKRGSPFRQTFVMSMAHELDFYVPTKKAFAEGSYEIVTSSLKPGAGERMVETALQLLRQLRD